MRAVKPQVMVGMQVADEYVVDFVLLQFVTQHLNLCTFSAIKQHTMVAQVKVLRTGVTGCSRCGRTTAQYGNFYRHY
jgi:hypothetical protein